MAQAAESKQVYSIVESEMHEDGTYFRITNQTGTYSWNRWALRMVLFFFLNGKIPVR